MAESSYQCSVSQGFNFEKDAQIVVGHINYLKIGMQEFAADLNVTDPEDVGKTVKVVGVTSNIFWEGGYAEPVRFECQLSVDNKNTASVLVHSTMSDTEVFFEFTVYEYDFKAKKYFKCFHSGDSQLQGLVMRNGRELELNIDPDASGEVVSPKNFAFALGVMPADTNQAIHIAVSSDAKFAKKWGVEVMA